MLKPNYIIYLSLKSVLVVFITGILVGCLHKNQSFDHIPNISITYCDTCKFESSVLGFEKEINSEIVPISDFFVLDFIGNKFMNSRTGVPVLVDLFQRVSTVRPFEEYVVYYYRKNLNLRPRTNTIFNDGSIIEFNCGTEPFGYDTTKANIEPYWEGRYPGLIPVRDVPIDSFKLGYYSIIKWLYNQETERYKVKKKKYEQFDHDYGPTASLITSENLVLEDPWQKEFLFTKYELIDTHSKDSYDYPRFIVVPYTLAPIHLYEVRPLKSEREKYVYKPDKYHINVADMAIRVYRYPTYEEMQRH